jgi:DNA polymerase
MRFQSKPAVLGCGYRLGGGEEIIDENQDKVKTGLLGYAASMGVTLTKKEAERCVVIFREKFPEVAKMWYALEEAAFYCLRTGEPQQVGHLLFEVFGRKLLRMTLPSGRALHYIHPTIELIPFRDYEKETLHYEGLSKKKQWTKLPTHGGRLIENACQAVARDILLHGMMEADKEGYTIVAHVHDEIIAEARLDSTLTLDGLINCMSRQPSWAPDLPLGAAGFESEYYKKG